MKKEFKLDKDKLLEALSKRAEGFFYSEEILEYGEAVSPRQKKDEEQDGDKTMSSAGEVEPKKNLTKSVSKNAKAQNHDIYSGRETQGAENKNEPQCNLSSVNNENSQNLILLKKKVTTHYIPPDLAAVKMLYEITGEEIGGSNNIIDNLSDEELLKLKSELIAEIKDDE